MSEREQPKQTLDAVEHQKNLEELRRKLVESIEFIDSWQEAERKKKEAVPPDFQEEEEPEDATEFEDETEDEATENETQ